MPFAGLEGSQDAEAENGGDGREPGAKQTNPASIRRRPQIFRKQCRCAKSDGIPFERQLETFQKPGSRGCAKKFAATQATPKQNAATATPRYRFPYSAS